MRRCYRITISSGPTAAANPLPRLDGSTSDVERSLAFDYRFVEMITNKAGKRINSAEIRVYHHHLYIYIYSCIICIYLYIYIHIYMHTHFCIIIHA